MKKNVLIRCDASKEIGLGHITRCLVLAKQLRNMGLKVYFALKNYKIAKEKVEEENFEILLASKDSFNYEKWILDICNEKGIDLFIGDIRDGLPTNVIKTLKEKEVLTVAIDEPSEYAKECDLCFYPPHANIDKTLYKGKVFKGFEYVILRPEFYKNFEKKGNDIPNVLIMLGGTDAKNLSFEVLSRITKITSNIKVKVILDINHKDYNSLKELNPNIEIYSNIKNMSSFLENIDFAVISFGTTAYELVVMNVPSLHICLNKDHYLASEWFVDNGYAKRIYYENIKLLNNLNIKTLNSDKKEFDNKIVDSILLNSKNTGGNFEKKYII